MSGDRHNGLSDNERDALRSIAQGPGPTHELEDRTVMALREHGLIRNQRGGTLMKLSIAVGTAAAVALIFMAGVVVGKRAGGTAGETTMDTATIEQAAPDERMYMLLLYTQRDRMGSEQRAQDPEAFAAIVDEYRAWGTRMAEANRFVGAEKLKNDVLVLADGGNSVANATSGENVLGGYFIIRAKDLEQAHQLALTHPHLKYGGRVEIRPVDLHD